MRCLILLLLLFTSGHFMAQKSQPNIILFLVDDMGWQDTSVPFWSKKTYLNERYHTPNMEKLAAQGMKFTNAYAHAVCSPTRISLMTGMNPARHRVTNWTLRKDTKTDRKDDDLLVPDWNVNGLSNTSQTANAIHATSLPEILQKEGYMTIIAGKSHLGAIDTPCSDPSNCGFDVNIAGHASGAPGSYQGRDNFGNDEDGKPTSVWSVPGLEEFYGQDINLTHAITLKAIRSLDQALEKSQPFFLYMSHYGIHTPIQPDHRFFRKYLDTGLDTIESKYASMIESMDHSLGSLIDYLEENDITEETIILFMSDNGGLSAHARGGELHKHNYPLRSGKGSSLEGGIRVPMIVKWPGVVADHSVTDVPVIIEDFYPSILNMAGIKQANTIQKIDGISFLPILKSEVSSRAKPLFWHMPNLWGGRGPGVGSYSAVRKGPWKLIYDHKTGSKQLYHLENDISEENNLVLSKAEKTAELSQILRAYLISTEAQMPVDKKSGKLIALP